MCKLIVGIKEPGILSKDLHDFVNHQYGDLKNEHDGIGTLLVNPNGETIITRELSVDKYGPVLTELLSKLKAAKAFAIHTRTGTSGLNDITNVHMFNNKNIVFAHNGFVGAYHKYKTYTYPCTTNRTLWGGSDYYPISYQPEKKSKKSKKAKHYTSVYYRGIDYGLTSMEQEQLDSLTGTLRNCKDCYDKYIKMDSDITTDGTSFCDTHKAQGLNYVNFCINHDVIPDPYDETVIESPWDEDENGVPVPVETTTPVAIEDEPKILTDKYCDSYQFMKDIPAIPSIKVLETLVDSKKFTGFGFVYDTSNNNIILIVKKEVHFIKNYTFKAWCSYRPTMSWKQTLLCTENAIPYEVETKYALPHDDFCVKEGIYNLDINYGSN